MVEGNSFINIVKEYFSFLIEEFDLKLTSEKVRVFYDIQYKDEIKTISISYENIEDYLLVIIFILQNGRLPDYDDKTHTLHLNKLNAKILANISLKEINLNSNYFLRFQPNNDLEKKLLKSAKELRLCLKYFDFIVNE